MQTLCQNFATTSGNSELKLLLDTWNGRFEETFNTLQSFYLGSMPIPNCETCSRPKSADFELPSLAVQRQHFRNVLELKAAVGVELEGLQALRDEIEDSFCSSEVHLHLERSAAENRRIKSTLAKTQQQVTDLTLTRRILEAEMTALRSERDRQLTEANERVRLAERALVAATTASSRRLSSNVSGQQQSTPQSSNTDVNPVNTSSTTGHRFGIGFKPPSWKNSNKFKDFTTLTAWSPEDFDLSEDEDEKKVDVNPSPVQEPSPTSTIPVQPIATSDNNREIVSPLNNDEASCHAIASEECVAGIPTLSSTPRKVVVDKTPSSSPKPIGKLDFSDHDHHQGTPIVRAPFDVDDSPVPRSTYNQLLRELDEVRLRLQTHNRTSLWDKTSGDNDRGDDAVKESTVCLSHSVRYAQENFLCTPCTLGEDGYKRTLTGLGEDVHKIHYFSSIHPSLSPPLDSSIVFYPADSVLIELKKQVDKLIQTTPKVGVDNSNNNGTGPLLPGSTRLFDWSASLNQTSPDDDGSSDSNERQTRDNDETHGQCEEQDTPKLSRSSTSATQCDQCIQLQAKCLSIEALTSARLQESLRLTNIELDEFRSQTQHLPVTTEQPSVDKPVLVDASCQYSQLICEASTQCHETPMDDDPMPSPIRGIVELNFVSTPQRGVNLQSSAQQHLLSTVNQYAKSASDAVRICLTLKDRIRSLGNTRSRFLDENCDRLTNGFTHELMTELRNDDDPDIDECRKSLLDALDQLNVEVDCLENRLSQLVSEGDDQDSTTKLGVINDRDKELIQLKSELATAQQLLTDQLPPDTRDALLETSRQLENERAQLQTEFEKRLTDFEQSHTSSVAELELSRRSLIDQLALAESQTGQLRDELTVLYTKLQTKERFLAEQTEERETEREEYQLELSRLNDELRQVRDSLRVKKRRDNINGPLLDDDDYHLVGESDTPWLLTKSKTNNSDSESTATTSHPTIKQCRPISLELVGLPPSTQTAVDCHSPFSSSSCYSPSPLLHPDGRVRDKGGETVADLLAAAAVDSPSRRHSLVSLDGSDIDSGQPELVIPVTGHSTVASTAPVQQTLQDIEVQTDFEWVSPQLLSHLQSKLRQLEETSQDGNPTDINHASSDRKVVRTITTTKRSIDAALLGALALVEESTVVSYEQQEQSPDDVIVEYKDPRMSPDGSASTDSSDRRHEKVIRELRHQLSECQAELDLLKMNRQLPDNSASSSRTYTEPNPRFVAINELSPGSIAPSAADPFRVAGSSPALIDCASWSEMVEQNKGASPSDHQSINLSNLITPTLDAQVQTDAAAAGIEDWVPASEVLDLTQRLETSEHAVTTLMSSVERLKKYQDDLQSDYDSLQGLVNEQEAELDRVNGEAQMWQDQCKLIKHQLKARLKIVPEHDEDVFILQQEKERLECKASELESELELLRSQSSNQHSLTDSGVQTDSSLQPVGHTVATMTDFDPVCGQLVWCSAVDADDPNNQDGGAVLIACGGDVGSDQDDDEVAQQLNHQVNSSTTDGTVTDDPDFKLASLPDSPCMQRRFSSSSSQQQTPLEAAANQLLLTSAVKKFTESLLACSMQRSSDIDNVIATSDDDRLPADDSSSLPALITNLVRANASLKNLVEVTRDLKQSPDDCSARESTPPSNQTGPCQDRLLQSVSSALACDESVWLALMTGLLESSAQKTLQSNGVVDESVWYDLTSLGQRLALFMQQENKYRQCLLASHRVKEASFSTELESNQHRIDTLMDEVKNLANRLSDRDHALAKVEATAIDLNSQVNDLKNQLTATSSDLQSERSQAESQRVQFDKLSAQYCRQQEALTASQSQLQESLAENSKLVQKTQLLQTELQQLKQNVNGWRQTINSSNFVENQNSPYPSNCTNPVMLTSTATTPLLLHGQSNHHQLNHALLNVTTTSATDSDSLEMSANQRRRRSKTAADSSQSGRTNNESLMTQQDIIASQLTAVRHAACKSEQQARELQTINRTLRLSLAEAELRLMARHSSVTSPPETPHAQQQFNNSAPPLNPIRQSSSSYFALDPPLASQRFAQLKHECIDLLEDAKAVASGNNASSRHRQQNLRPLCSGSDSDEAYRSTATENCRQATTNAGPLLVVVSQASSNQHHQSPTNCQVASSSTTKHNSPIVSHAGVSIGQYRQLYLRFKRTERNRRALIHQKQYLSLLLESRPPPPPIHIRQSPLSYHHWPTTDSSFPVVYHPDVYSREDGQTSPPIRRFRIVGRLVQAVCRQESSDSSISTLDGNDDSSNSGELIASHHNRSVPIDRSSNPSSSRSEHRSLHQQSPVASVALRVAVHQPSSSYDNQIPPSPRHSTPSSCASLPRQPGRHSSHVLFSPPSSSSSHRNDRTSQSLGLRKSFH